MKAAAYRIFRNSRWSYSDQPSTRNDERAAWQPLYSAMELHEYEARIRADVYEECATLADELFGLRNAVSDAIRGRKEQ